MQKGISKNSIVLGSISILVFLFLINNYDNIYIRNIDEFFLNWLISNTNYIMVYFFKIITVFANWQMIALLTLLLLVLIKDKISVILISSLVGFITILNVTLKKSIERVRPNVIQLTVENGFSMPSAHALVAVVFYGLMILFFTSKIKNRNYRNLINVLIVILIFLIGLSRMYLRVHYLSDIIAGWSLGIVILSIVYNVKVGVFDTIKTYIEGEEVE